MWNRNTPNSSARATSRRNRYVSDAFASGSRPSHARPSRAPSWRAAASVSGASLDGGTRCRWAFEPASGSPGSDGVAAAFACVAAGCSPGFDSVIDPLRLVVGLVVRELVLVDRGLVLVVHEVVAIIVELILVDDVRLVVPLRRVAPALGVRRPRTVSVGEQRQGDHDGAAGDEHGGRDPEERQLPVRSVSSANRTAPYQA